MSILGAVNMQNMLKYTPCFARSVSTLTCHPLYHVSVNFQNRTELLPSHNAKDAFHLSKIEARNIGFVKPYTHLAGLTHKHWKNQNLLKHGSPTCAPLDPGFRILIKTCSSNSASQPSPKPSSQREIKENIFTIPNLLTLSRIILTPVLGYCVLSEWYILACSIFIYAGATDMLDGWIARRYVSQMSSFGSFLDPLADKLLVSTLFITLSMMQLIPMPLTAIVIARDVGLVAAAFYVRYISLPPPKTLQRYFNATHVTSNLKPLFISKLNTALQLGLVAFTLPAPVFSYVDHVALQALWYVTASTTIASGIAYVFAKDTFKIVSNNASKK